MSPVSAKGGTLTLDTNEVPDVTNVTINQSSELQEYGSSSTDGNIARVAGHSDFTISATILSAAGAFAPQSGAAPSDIAEGDIISNVIAQSAAGETVTGNCIVVSIGNAVPIGDGGLVSIDIELAHSSGGDVTS